MFEEVNKALLCIEKGGIILYPTDTIWGIGCDATNQDAIKKIYALKQRDDAKSLIMLIAEAKDIFKYVANPHPDIVAMLQQMERPTTVIYNHPIDLPSAIINKEDYTIAIRVTKDPFCKALIKRLKKPLVSTSANISGNPAPSSFRLVDEKIKAGVDYIVAHRQEEEDNPPASRILKLNEDGSFLTIRA